MQSLNDRIALPVFIRSAGIPKKSLPSSIRTVEGQQNGPNSSSAFPNAQAYACLALMSLMNTFVEQVPKSIPTFTNLSPRAGLFFLLSPDK
jgi:hypothetical protein